MALVRWEPAQELQSLQQEVNRVFGSFFEPVRASAGRGMPRQWVPATDLVETDGEYVLRADLPGLSEEDVTVELEDNVLTLAGERTAEHEDRSEGYYRIERASGSFSRSLTLPEGVDGENIRATFARGVLEVRIPKPEQRKPTRVAISVSGSADDVDAAPSATSEG